MFKRKSTPPTISPLPPPQSQPSDRRLSHLQTQPMPQQHQQQQHLGGPAYQSGSPVDRVGSYDNRSVKSDKRRSGFFGFGKKDKDKEHKEKEVCGSPMALARLYGFGFWEIEGRGVVWAQVIDCCARASFSHSPSYIFPSCLLDNPLSL